MNEVNVGPFPFEGRDEFGGCASGRGVSHGTEVFGDPKFTLDMSDDDGIIAHNLFGSDFGSDLTGHDPNDDAHNFWVDATSGDGITPDESEEAEAEEHYANLREQLLGGIESVSQMAQVRSRPFTASELAILASLVDEGNLESGTQEIFGRRPIYSFRKFRNEKVETNREIAHGNTKRNRNFLPVRPGTLHLTRR